MIYVTGDTHGSFNRFSLEAFPEQAQMTKDDYLIICGDFGGIWSLGCESEFEKSQLDWFESRNYTLLFIDGNHENFDRLYNYPVKDWHGGKIHEIRPHVLHLMRGYVYEIDGKKIFSFGGASSHDVSGGILQLDDLAFERMRIELNKSDKPYRINHVSWWAEELASEEEMTEGLRNLKNCNNKVDYIITHCCSTSTQEQLGIRKYKPNKETDYLEYIKNNVAFTYWFFGHYHDNINVNDKEFMLYEELVQLN